jgi:nucleoid-associated protein YgaU
MTGETRAALLIGLFLLVAFGLILGEISGPVPDGPPPAIRLTDIDYAARTQHARDVRPDRGTGRLANLLWNRGDSTVPTGAQDRPIHARADVDARNPAERSDLAARHARGAVGDRETGGRTPRGAADTRGRVFHQVRREETLIALARKYYGADQGHRWVRIYQANRDRLADPSVLPAGVRLRIPPPSGALTSGGRSGDALAERSEAPAQPRTRSGRRYVIRRGDNLTKLARQFLGDDSPRAVRRLFEANEDRLANPDELPVGVELVIPS